MDIINDTKHRVINKIKTLRPYQAIAVTDCWDALKKNDEPVLLMASVGAGKSLMLGAILLTMQKANKKALCLVNNAELVRNNCETFMEQGGLASIFCAALGVKDISQSIIFATPQTILNAINKNHPIGDIEFNMIMVDEAHAINYLNHRSSFMRVLRHYKQQYKDMRVIGATGTNFRFKGTSIVGDDCLFKSQVGNITTEQLINDEYLINPTFEIDKTLVIDFSKVKIKQNGQFDQKELAVVIDKSTRLTELICKQVTHIMESQQRKGVFFFASTKKHAYEILSHLPEDESAIILGETPQNERTDILHKARTGKIRYLVNIAIISVGVDIPSFDTIAYLRPTESLVLLVQTMGRVLRLSPTTCKTSALVLDFAGNIDRHRDWDNPILQEAVKQTLDLDKPLVISCPECLTMNTEHARRCVGKENKEILNETNIANRCNYYFEFKQCNNIINEETCDTKNDIAARLCRSCKAELIDPNKKLSMARVQHNVFKVNVLEARYGISGTQKGFRINCAYKCKDEKGQIGSVYEHYTPSSERSARVFYGQFVRKHCQNASKWYTHLTNRTMVEEMLKTVNSPQELIIYKEPDSLKIKKKIFSEQ